MIPFELVIYLCVGIALMIGVFVLDWFGTDAITGSTVGMGLLMVFFWPLGLICLVGAAISIICDEDRVILRRKK